MIVYIWLTIYWKLSSAVIILRLINLTVSLYLSQSILVLLITLVLSLIYSIDIEILLIQSNRICTSVLIVKLVLLKQTLWRQSICLLNNIVLLLYARWRLLNLKIIRIIYTYNSRTVQLVIGPVCRLIQNWIRCS